MKKNRLVLGILAHVDAGKTTLAEQILYHCGNIRKPGRVDHKDTFLDHHTLERTRGITIFSKQAELILENREITLLDTPGHVDFSAEMERTLQVLDAAILVINASDGVQGHTRTLWRLLKRYRVPVFLFVNKMDLPDADSHKLLQELQQHLDEYCLDFSPFVDIYEDMAMSDELAMEKYLETGILEIQDVIRLISERKIFPCYFGSALKGDGIETLLQGVEKYAKSPDYGDRFGARVFKITRDEQNNRLTHMKITGGSLRVKTLLTIPVRKAEEPLAEQEKVDRIRIYSGSSFQSVEEVKAGEICAIAGLEKTFAGDGLGMETTGLPPFLEPVLTYGVILPEGCDLFSAYSKLSLLEEEDPQLHITWEKAAREIHAQVMGEIQIQILKNMIKERFGLSVEFGAGSIVYKETIGTPVIGMGHFEPLRHYAEVHLLMEPAEPGSGLQLESHCSEDQLDRNWQRLILTHLRERQHKGVLTGAEITDMKIILIAGKAHLKHTEGGDFRQAAYRAVRQGLKSADSVLLEPVYQFQLELPTEMLGKAMADIRRMQGSFDPPVTMGEEAILTGSAPVATMQGYQTEVLKFTKGCGRLFCSLSGYEPCHNAEEVIAEKDYDSETDPDHPTGSIFCSHGAGFSVEWDKVGEYMHVDSVVRSAQVLTSQENPAFTGTHSAVSGEPMQTAEDQEIQRIQQVQRAQKARTDEKELETIFQRTYGSIQQKRTGRNRTEKKTHYFSQERNQAEDSYTSEKSVSKNLNGNEKTGHDRQIKEKQKQEEYLLVDGYNIIFAWKELKELAEVNLEAARGRLADILCNYQGYKNNTVILVFDAWRVAGGRGEYSRYLNIHIVYTKEAETADMYIEKTTREIGKKYRVTVATSDMLEQMIVWGHGAMRLSAEDLRQEIEQVSRRIREEHLTQPQEKNYLRFRGR